MRPLAVVMVGIDGADEPLCDRVRLWCSHWRLHYPDAFAAEDLVEAAAVLAVAVANQETNALLCEVETEVARLLRHPLAGGVLRTACEPDAAARMGDEEEHVEAAEQDRLDGEEVAGDDARPPGTPELTPAGT